LIGGEGKGDLHSSNNIILPLEQLMLALA